MPELVYLLARPYWNLGFATELANTCLEYGFMRHKFKQIIALTRPDNLASRRVMEKVGLSYQRSANIFNIDVVLYSLTRRAYLARCLSMHAAASHLSAAALK
jgi:ribosomal-protein-alanine N-acetyltransferase